MSIYTVHEPPLKADESTPDPDRFVFVRDGFSFWAFLLAPLWMLRHRLWLVFVGYVIVAVALQVGLRLHRRLVRGDRHGQPAAGVARRFRGRHVASFHAGAPALEERRHRRR